MAFGQPRPPLMGYGGTLSYCALCCMVIVGMCFLLFTPLFPSLLFEQVDLLTPLTSTEEAGATTTTSVDKVATWGSHATLGETTVRVIFILR